MQPRARAGQRPQACTTHSNSEAGGSARGKEYRPAHNPSNCYSAPESKLGPEISGPGRNPRTRARWTDRSPAIGNRASAAAVAARGRINSQRGPVPKSQMIEKGATVRQGQIAKSRLTIRSTKLQVRCEYRLSLFCSFLLLIFARILACLNV